MAYHLLEDDSDFEHFDDFVSLIGRAEGKRKYQKLAEIYKAVADSWGVSQPMIDELEEDRELKKLRAAM